MHPGIVSTLIIGDDASPPMPRTSGCIVTPFKRTTLLRTAEQAMQKRGAAAAR